MLKLVPFAVLLLGCEDFQNPSNLPKHQVIAMQANPASIAPGDMTNVNVVVAGPTGIEQPTSISWELVPVVQGTPTIGSIIERPDGTVDYQAPATIDEEPTVAAVEATVTTATGTLNAVKFVGISSLGQISNPTITSVLADGVDVTAGWSYTPGKTSELEITTANPLTDDAAFAWYTSAGEISLYQSNPTEILLPEQSVQGRLIIVLRDGQGGITWDEIEMTPN